MDIAFRVSPFSFHDRNCVFVIQMFLGSRRSEVERLRLLDLLKCAGNLSEQKVVFFCLL